MGQFRNHRILQFIFTRQVCSFEMSDQVMAAGSDPKSLHLDNGSSTALKYYGKGA
jgi:hypothetical protein